MNWKEQRPSQRETFATATDMHPIWVSGTPGEEAKIKLAQDVARFANGDVAAVLVSGYREASGASNEIGTLAPVNDTCLNGTQI